MLLRSCDLVAGVGQAAHIYMLDVHSLSGQLGRPYRSWPGCAEDMQASSGASDPPLVPVIKETCNQMKASQVVEEICIPEMLLVF